MRSYAFKNITLIMLILLVAGGEFRREFRREFRETVQNADNLLLNRQRRNGNAIF